MRRAHSGTRSRTGGIDLPVRRSGSRPRPQPRSGYRHRTGGPPGV